MASKWNQSRCAVACKFCLKVQDTLPVHLKRTCRRFATAEEIDSLVKEGRERMRTILRKLSVVKFEDLQFNTADPREFFTRFLEERGCYIQGKPLYFGTSTMLTTENEIERTTDNDEEVDEDIRGALKRKRKDGEDEERDREREHSKKEQREREQQERERREREEENEQENRPRYRILACSSSNILDDVDLRRRMEESGLYKKHPVESRIFDDFRRFLTENLQVPNCKQEVSNVSRFMYFMDPKEPSLNFVRNIEKRNQFIAKLFSVGNTHSTVFSYLKSLKKFMRYQIFSTDLVYNNPKLYQDCERFHRATGEYKKDLKKSISRNIARKIDDFIAGDVKAPEKCQRIPDTTHPVFKLKDTDCSTKKDIKDTLYEMFLTIFPQEVDTTPPTLKQAFSFCRQHGTYLYERWWKTQYRSRVAHICGKLPMFMLLL
ncbi:hypothetical protein GDO86_020523 [Hymenochirus boettgeri]|uniref:Uncharacterized protein n=1 Tax=Hymenochirus boettgeri TaxID=247094 RepID=A0A8T2IG84_9PIPI|nr:hypothetical protein GDO86_020523 [Hymenochirus boettgeri]